MPAAIEITNLSKRYQLTSDRARTLKETVLRLFEPGETWQVGALKPLTLRVERGETLGIIGQNGAGKSTLLKLISGVTAPTTGTVRVDGSLMALIELGAGFEPELSGWENLFLTGSVMGIPDRRMTELSERIVAFAGLEKFIHIPIKHYSSGMVLRLGFAITAFLEPDVILLDENLAVGDAAFQAKCIARLQELRAAGKTILLVTHQLDVAEWLCDRILWLDDGEVSQLGKPTETVKRYERLIAGKQQVQWDEAVRGEARIGSVQGRYGSGDVVISDVSLLDEEGQPRHVVRAGSDVTVRVEIETRAELKDVNIEIGVTREDRFPLFTFNLKRQGRLMDLPPGGSSVSIRLPNLCLSSGRYFLNVGLSPGNNELKFYDLHLFLYHFRVASPLPQRLQSLIHSPASITVVPRKPGAGSPAPA